jgi:hypothetical protein
VYYVDGQAGDDSNDGTSDAPWKTIIYANDQLVAGDTLYIRPGTYNEFIKPARRGKAAERITYRNDPDTPGTVLLAGLPGYKPIIDVGTDYVSLYGLEVKWGHAPPGGDRRWEWSEIKGSHCTIQNCKFYRTEDPYELRKKNYRESGVAISGDHCLVEACDFAVTLYGVTVNPGAHFVTIRGNRVLDVGGSSLNIFDSNGEMRGLLIEGNVLGNVVTGDCIQFQTSSDRGTYPIENRGIVVRNNVIYGGGENALDLKDTGYIVIEHNTISGCIGSNDGPYEGWNRWAFGSITVGGDRQAKQVIVRNNLIVDSCGGIEVQGDDYYIYNNTFANNNRDFTGPNSTAVDPKEPQFTAMYMNHKRDRICFKNNIVEGHNSAEVALHLADAGCSYDIDYNVYHNKKGALFAKQMVDRFVSYAFISWQKLLSGFGTVSGNDANSQEADPLFVNVPDKPTGDPRQYDFHLRAGSPAINAGGPLTRTKGKGSGVELAVDDAGYFFDGFGVVVGDMVKVGSNGAVQVVEVDYVNSKLRLATAITWRDNDPVYLGDYHDSAPDVGAFEYGSA